jgi:cytochrome b pre-mRNA-processing protein 3
MPIGWFKRRQGRDVPLRVYERVAEASRRPWLYAVAGVPDTVEGRIESLTLHMFLLARRLRALPTPAPELAQEVVDTLFTHIDHGLRELGVGDASVPKRMKSIAGAYSGRVQAYGQALDGGEAGAFEAALQRNITIGADASALAAYARACEAELAGRGLQDVIDAGDDLFPLPEDIA